MPTRVGNQTIQTACSAMHTDETSRKDPTIQEGTELTLDEFRYIPVSLALPGKKSFQMSGNDTIEGIPINEGLRTIARDKRRSVYQSDFNSPEVGFEETKKERNLLVNEMFGATPVERLLRDARRGLRDLSPYKRGGENKSCNLALRYS